MPTGLYLLRITTSGLKSIEKPITINFYKKNVDKNFNPDEYRVKAIYGENGAGKSSIITSINLFKNIVSNEDYLSDNNTQILLNELINKKTKHFIFECEFLNELNKKFYVYKYRIELKYNEKNKYEISYEHLEQKNGNYAQSQYRTVFECSSGILKSVDCSPEDEQKIRELSFNLLKSKSLESIILSNIEKMNDWGIEGSLIFSSIFCAVLALVTKVYLEEKDKHELYFIQKQLNEEFSKEQFSYELFNYFNKYMSEFTSVTEKRVRKADFDKYKEKVNGLASFVRLFKKNLVCIDIDAKENANFYECELILDYGDYRIAKEFESTGIKKIINLYDSLLNASKGGIVFIDEMDSNINDVYLCKMIEYFMYYGKGQLCFTTHNIDPMNILKENRNSIEFLSNDNVLVPWTKKGNSCPENAYKNGLITNLPFNIAATDFIGILGD